MKIVVGKGIVRKTKKGNEKIRKKEKQKKGKIEKDNGSEASVLS